MRPNFHYTPEKNWLNDPNGLCFYKGTYHMYYQHNPKNPYWGNMSWGHATSTDLVHWTEYAPAMVPSFEMDRDGCFSGSALPLGDRILYAYTGIRYTESVVDEHGNRVATAPMKPVQLFAESIDGHVLVKDEKTVTKPPTDIDSHEFRDPKLFEVNGVYYFVVAVAKEAQAGLLFYRSEDLKNWKPYRRHIFDDKGIMLECPDYFELGGQGLVMYSAIGIYHDGDKDAIGYSEYDFKTGDFGPFERLDLGQKFYAPQTFEDRSGKRVVIGWMKMVGPFAGEAWTGMMCFPRVVTYKNGRLHQELHEAIEDIVVSCKEIRLVDGTYGYTAEESETTVLNIGNFTGTLELSIGDNKLYMQVEKERLFFRTVLDGEVRSYTIDESLNDMTILKDAHCFELFINEGRYTLAEVYRTAGKGYSYTIKGSDGSDMTGQIKLLEK